MATDKSQQVMTKVVHRDGMSFTLYSLDGHTWSSKQQELEQIQERIESGRPSFLDKKNQPMAKKRPRPAEQADDHDEEPSGVVSKEAEELDEELDEGEEESKPAVDLAERSLRMRLVAEAPLEDDEDAAPAPPTEKNVAKVVKPPKDTRKTIETEKKGPSKAKIEVKSQAPVAKTEKLKTAKVIAKKRPAVKAAKPTATSKKVAAKSSAAPKKKQEGTSKKAPHKATEKGKGKPVASIKKKK